jgi:ankyrin repeat protein
LEKGEDVEAKDKFGVTALHKTAQNRQEAVTQLLLEKGADIEAKDNYGCTALHWATVVRHSVMVRLLPEKGRIRGVLMSRH